MGEKVPDSRENIVTQERVKPEIKPPSMYRVLMHNDHYTTMEFVVAVLQAVFHKPLSEATKIMLQIHQNGIGICGVYTAEVAETKITTVHRTAEEYGYPLKCTMEPE